VDLSIRDTSLVFGALGVIIVAELAALGAFMCYRRARAHRSQSERMP
jgi:hypothetical protein